MKNNKAQKSKKKKKMFKLKMIRYFFIKNYEC